MALDWSYSVWKEKFRDATGSVTYKFDSVLTIVDIALYTTAART